VAQTTASELFAKCVARIDRAVYHSNEVANVWNSLDISRMLEVAVFVKDDGSGVMEIEQHEPLPEILELELGEYLYQLRAALDGAVYASAIEDSGLNAPSNPAALEFPLCEKAKDWPRQARKIAQLNAGRQRFIEACQPFAEPQLEPELRILNSNRALRILNDLARIDRHRRLHTLATAVSMGQPLFEFPEGVSLCSLELKDAYSSDGPAARFSLVGWKHGMNLRANPNAEIDISLESVEPACHVNDTLPNRLKSIVQNVRIIVSLLKADRWLATPNVD
jgi:hypothetical protein